MLRKPLLFSTIIWLSGVLCSPILFAMISSVYNADGSGFIIVPYAWIFGGLLSLPSYLILIILNFQLTKRNLSEKTYIGILLLSCTGLAILAFSMLSIYFGEFDLFDIDPGFIALIGSYLVSLYAAILSALFSPSKKMIDSLDASEVSSDNGS